MSLSPHQLCDLVNFVLGLPDRLGDHTVIHPPIGPWVISSWTSKQMLRVCAWAEALLRKHSVLPACPTRTDPDELPYELRRLVYWKVA